MVDSATMVTKPHHLFGMLQGRKTEGDFNAYDVRRPRKVHIFCNGDRYFRGKLIHLNFNRYRNFNDLLNDLTGKLPNTVHLTYGVRQIFTPVTGRKIHNISQLQDGQEYVCAGFETFKPLKYGSEIVMESWGAGGKSRANIESFGDTQSSPPTFSAQNAFHTRRQQPKLMTGQKFAKFRSNAWGIHSSTDAYARPKAITVFHTGAKPHPNVKILLNRHGVQSVDQFLKDVSEAFGQKWSRLRKLYSLRGREVNNVGDFFHADDIFIGVGSDEPTLGEVNEILGQLYPESPYAEQLLRKWENAKRQRNREALTKRREAVKPSLAFSEASSVKKFPDEGPVANDKTTERKLSGNMKRTEKAIDGNRQNPAEAHALFDYPRNEEFVNETMGKTSKIAGSIKVNQSQNKMVERKQDEADNEVIEHNQNMKEHRFEKEGREKYKNKSRNFGGEWEQDGAVDGNQQKETDRDRAIVRNGNHKRDNDRQLQHEGQKEQEKEKQRQCEKENENVRQHDLDIEKEREKLKLDQKEMEKQNEMELLRKREKEKEKELERKLEILGRRKHQIRLKPISEQRRNAVSEEKQESGRLSSGSNGKETFPLKSIESGYQAPLKEQDSLKNLVKVKPDVSTGRRNNIGDRSDKLKEDKRLDGTTQGQTQEELTESIVKKQADTNDFRILSSHSRRNEIVKDKFRNINSRPGDDSRKSDASKGDKAQRNANKLPHNQEKLFGDGAKQNSPQAGTINSSRMKKHSKQTVCKSKIERQISSTEHVFSKYELSKVLGDGNFAVVKCCRHRPTNQEYAMKVIDKSKLRGKENMIENEIMLMKICDHPNIVKLFEEFETNTEIFLVMELVKGGDLFDAITQSVKFSEINASKMVFDLAQALYYLHSRSVVHRDLKPENILVHHSINGETSLKLADFGLAMEVKEPIYTVCGTPTYVAPEILSEIGYGLEIDMWALGVITYILLCGFPPFRSTERKQTELFECIKAGEFEFLRPYWDNKSKESKALIRRLLVVDPKERYSATDVLCDPFIVTFAGSQLIPDINSIMTNRRRELDQKAIQNQEQFHALMMKRKV